MAINARKWSGWDQISSRVSFASIGRVDNTVVVDEHMVVGMEMVIDQHYALLVWYRVFIDRDQVPQQPPTDKAPDMLYHFP